MNIEKLTANLTILRITFISLILSIIKTTDPKPNLGKDTISRMSILPVVMQEEDIKAFGDIKDEANMSLFIVTTNIDGEKVKIEPVGGDSNEEKGFTKAAENDWKFTFKLKPEDQQFNLIRATIKTKKNMIEVHKALEEYNNAKKENDDEKKKAQDALKKAWKASTAEVKIGSAKINESGDIVIEKIENKDNDGLKDKEKPDVQLVGDAGFEGLKTKLSFKIRPWNDKTFEDQKISNSYEASDKKGKLLPDDLKNGDKEFKFVFEKDNSKEIENLYKVFAKQDGQPITTTTSNTVTETQPNGPSSSDAPSTTEEASGNPWHKSWWFITLIVLLVLGIIGGAVFVFRKQIFGGKGKRKAL